MQTLQHPSTTDSKTRQDLSPEEIDNEIVKQIDLVTKENSSIWTSPDYNRREYIHSFFQYPAMMVPVVQKKLVEIITSADPNVKKVIDPFMGSATTLVICMEFGLTCYGQDINPLAILISKARTGPYFVRSIKAKSDLWIENIENDSSDEIEVNFKGREKWFKTKTSRDISKIIRVIRKEPNIVVRRFLWVVLAEAIRVSSNDRTSTFKLHIRDEEDIKKRTFSIIDAFKVHLDNCIEDYELHFKLLKSKGHLVQGSYQNGIQISLGNSKKRIHGTNKVGEFDLLVTSPPYGDNKTTVTYGQHSYLPLQWIDLSDIDKKVTDEFLRTTLEIDSRSLGGKLTNLNERYFETMKEVSPTLSAVIDKLESKAPDKVNKVKSFMIDMDLTLENLMNVMRENSYQIWTLGNRTVGGLEIPNDQIVRELIISKGGKYVAAIKREILNKRMAKRNKDTALMNTEDILIFRKLPNDGSRIQ